MPPSEINGRSLQQRALVQLNSNELEFVLLREPQCWSTAKDIDLLIKNEEKADTILSNFGYVCYAHKGHHRWYLKYSWEDKEWIHLDVHTTISFGKYKPPKKYIKDLFNNVTISNDDIPRINPLDHSIILFFHSVLDKKKIDERYKGTIFNFDYYQIKNKSSSYSFLSLPLESYYEWLGQVKAGRLGEKKMVRQVLCSLGAKTYQRKSYLVRAFNRIRRCFYGSGTIAFLGPDGAGKSTLIEPLAKLKHLPIRTQYMGPNRKSVMRNILNLTMDFLSNIRFKHNKSSVIGQGARICWHFLCYLDFFDRKYRHLLFQSKGGVVIYDRYPCDMFFRSPSKLYETLYIKLFPLPRLIILCTGDAKMINARKNELSVTEIESTIRLYFKKISDYNIKYVLIDTTKQSPEICLMNLLIEQHNNKWQVVT